VGRDDEVRTGDRTRNRDELPIDGLTSTMLEHAEIPMLLWTAVRGLGSAFGCDQVLVVLMSPDWTPGPVLAEWTSDRVEPVGVGNQPEVPESFIRLVATNVLEEGTLAIDDVDTDSRLAADTVEFLRQRRAVSALVSPILLGDELRALLSLQVGPPGRTWSPTERWMARSLGSELGGAMQLGTLFEQERLLVRRLQQLDSARSEFISSVSHELRTPLTSILGYTELLLDGDVGELAEQQSTMMAVVDRNARRLLLLIDDLLDTSRIEADRFVVVPAEVAIGRLVDSLTDAIQPLADAAGLRLEVDVPDRTATVWADERAVERALLNLLSNAVKFTLANGVVTLSGRRNDGGVEFSVRDTGVGIPEDEQDQLFTRFFRSSTSRKLAVQGTGLGLAIVRHIVEAHGGTVSVQSRSGEGTRFTLQFPPRPAS
jgi:signal transduction histidine kinase